MTEYHIKEIKDSNLKLIHADQKMIKTEVVEETHKAKYVGEFCVRDKLGNWANQACWLFYNKAAHPRGSNYFIIYVMQDILYLTDPEAKPRLYISDGISAVQDKDGNKVVYTGIKAEDDHILYSSYRHDYQLYKDVMIDGGRDYTKHSLSGDLVQFYIQDGEIKLVD